MNSVSKRARFLIGAAVLLASSLPGLSACAALQSHADDRQEYVSKTRLMLNIGAIPDPATRAQAEMASRDVAKTLNTLNNNLLDQREVEAALQWAGPQALLLPPQNSGLSTYEKHPAMKRWSFALKRTDEWKSIDRDNISVLVSFEDMTRVAPDVRERQYYRQANHRWRLIKQERQ